MRRDFRGRTVGHEAEIVEGDLEEIASCDAVLAAFTAPDEGTAMEAWHAHSHRAAGRRLHRRHAAAPWTVYVADERVCADLEAPSPRSPRRARQC